MFPGGKERPGLDADLSPPSSAVVKNEYSYTSTPPMGRTACREPQCLYKGALYLYLYHQFITANLIKRMDNFHITTNVTFVWNYVTFVGIQQSNTAVLDRITTNFRHALITQNVKEIAI